MEKIAKKLDGKVAIVTGSGRSVALKLASESARLVVNDLDVEPAQATTTNTDSTVKIEGRDIRVGVSPGLMEMFEQNIPLGHAGTPEQAAGAVYLLCIPESDYICGQTVVCGGATET